MCPEVIKLKHFHVSGTSGVLAAATTGVIGVFRNSNTGTIQYIQRVRCRLGPITVPTTAQEVALALNLQSVFSANYTGGTDLLTAVRARILDVQRVLQSSYTPTSTVAAGDIRIASTAALAAGGGDVVDTQPYVRAGIWHPATAAQTDVIPDLILDWVNPTQGLEHNDPSQGCIPLLPNTGFNVNLPVALGTAYTARFTMEVDWLE